MEPGRLRPFAREAAVLTAFLQQYEQTSLNAIVQLQTRRIEMGVEKLRWWPGEMTQPPEKGRP